MTGLAAVWIARGCLAAGAAACMAWAVVAEDPIMQTGFAGLFAVCALGALSIDRDRR